MCHADEDDDDEEGKLPGFKTHTFDGMDVRPSMQPVKASQGPAATSMVEQGMGVPYWCILFADCSWAAASLPACSCLALLVTQACRAKHCCALES